MKIALLCTGVGRTFRGLERFTLELFNTVKNELPVTLFGANSFPSLRTSYRTQQLSYLFSFIPFAVWQKYDLIHYSEPGIGNFLYHAKKKFGFKYKMLFTNWGMEGPYCLRPDHLQEITLPAYQRTVGSGIPEEKVTFLPYGLNTKNFNGSHNQAALREKYGIPKDKIVILSVAALNRRHKRIDYLIREVNRLGKDFFLLVIGQPEEPDLNSLGCELLGENFKSMYVPFDQMREIYHLANLFVIPSLIEGFCLALVEAMCAGLPVVANDTAIFQWIVGEPKCLTDLSREGGLAEKIREVAANDDVFQDIARQNRARVIERFDWNYLKQDYLNLYERVS